MQSDRNSLTGNVVLDGVTMASRDVLLSGILDVHLYEIKKLFIQNQRGEGSVFFFILIFLLIK